MNYLKHSLISIQNIIIMSNNEYGHPCKQCCGSTSIFSGSGSTDPHLRKWDSTADSDPIPTSDPFFFFLTFKGFKVQFLRKKWT